MKFNKKKKQQQQQQNKKWLILNGFWYGLCMSI